MTLAGGLVDRIVRAPFQLGEDMQPITEFDHPDHGWKWTELELRWINARIASEVAAEREACAKICDVVHKCGPNGAGIAADKIRARSNA